MKKCSKVRLSEMKEKIYDNMYGAAVDDGDDDMEAEEAALDYVNGLTKKQIVKEYEEINDEI